MLNKVILMGRFTQDAELRSTLAGISVTSFTVAVGRDFTGKDGEKKTDFINCVAFKGTAEFITKYFRKGSMAIIEGRIETRSWDDADGKKRYATEVIVNNIYFGESKKDTVEAVDNAPDCAPMGTDEGLPF